MTERRIAVLSSADDATARARRVWLVGGILLVASVIVRLVLGPLVSATIGVDVTGGVLAGAALIVFALGRRRRGSITARRPLGTVALVALAVWGLVWPVLRAVLVAFGHESADWFMALVRFEPIAHGAIALIACVQIARAGVVPSPWRWAPLWALAAVALMRVLGQIPFIGSAGLLLGTLESLVGIGSTLFLGILAIVLASRPTRSRSVTIFDSRSF